MRINPSITLLTGVLAVSTGAVFARAADAPALTVAAYRGGLASLVLVPAAIWTARDELSGLSAKDLLTAMLSCLFLALLGSVCAAFYLLLGRNLRKKLSLISYITVCYASAGVILWALVLGLGLQFRGFSGRTVAAF